MCNNLFILFYGTSSYVSNIRKPDEILVIGAVILFKQAVLLDFSLKI